MGILSEKIISHNTRSFVEIIMNRSRVSFFSSFFFTISESRNVTEMMAGMEENSANYPIFQEILYQCMMIMFSLLLDFEDKAIITYFFFPAENRQLSESLKPWYLILLSCLLVTGQLQKLEGEVFNGDTIVNVKSKSGDLRFKRLLSDMQARSKKEI